MRVEGMRKRTPAEVGKIVAARRIARELKQENIPGISSSLVRQIEKGEAPPGGRPLNRAAFMRALRWPPDALERLAHGEDPAKFPAPQEAPPLTTEERLAVLERQMQRILRGEIDDA